MGGTLADWKSRPSSLRKLWVAAREGKLWTAIFTSTATIKFRDRVGRVTPCAPFLGRSVNRGAHGVTRPTVAAGGVTKFICRCTSPASRQLRNVSNCWLPTMSIWRSVSGILDQNIQQSPRLATLTGCLPFPLSSSGGEGRREEAVCSQAY